MVKLNLTKAVDDYITKHDKVKKLTGDCINDIRYDLHLESYGKKTKFDDDLYRMVLVPFENMEIVYDILNIYCNNLKQHNINPKDIIHICYHDCTDRKKPCCEYHTFCINKICTICKKSHKKRK